ncbi:MAG: hypothetical protein KH436_08415 [Firmicutes bacterium]|nr:hypothetical protein [Bacillota bacterium]
MLKAYHKETGKEIKKGDIIKDFRNDENIFIMATRATKPGKAGKVLVKSTEGSYEAEYYATVFNLIIKDE